MELWKLPESPMLRLKHYQHERALEEEKRLVEAALAVPEIKRTERERSLIAYSQFGTAAGCGCQRTFTAHNMHMKSQNSSTPDR